MTCNGSTRLMGNSRSCLLSIRCLWPSRNPKDSLPLSSLVGIPNFSTLILLQNSIYSLQESIPYIMDKMGRPWWRWMALTNQKTLCLKIPTFVFCIQLDRASILHLLVLKIMLMKGTLKCSNKVNITYNSALKSNKRIKVCENAG